MISQHIFLLLTLVAVASHAVFLDHATYDSLAAALGPPGLLFITVRWCDHCRALTPELKALARAVHRASDVLVAHVDADDEPAVPARLGVRGYPTVLFLPTGYKLGGDGAVEYGDYRWAEIMAEFVNNQTGEERIRMHPREVFLRWRAKVPHNLGEQVEEGETRQDDDQGLGFATNGVESGGVLGIREPREYDVRRFDREVLTDAATRFMVLFYAEGDPFLRDIMLQWRQASSAFTGADEVAVGIVDVEQGANANLAGRYGLVETPRCLYFPKCKGEGDLPQCKKPLPCDGAMEETEDIIQFISNQLLAEMGITPDDDNRGKTYHLTQEEYQKRKQGGTVFANDPEQEDIVRQLNERLQETTSAETPHIQEKDEL